MKSAFNKMNVVEALHFGKMANVLKKAGLHGEFSKEDCGFLLTVKTPNEIDSMDFQSTLDELCAEEWSQLWKDGVCLAVFAVS